MNMIHSLAFAAVAAIAFAIGIGNFNAKAAETDPCFGTTSASAKVMTPAVLDAMATMFKSVSGMELPGGEAAMAAANDADITIVALGDVCKASTTKDEMGVTIWTVTHGNMEMAPSAIQFAGAEVDDLGRPMFAIALLRGDSQFGLLKVTTRVTFTGEKISMSKESLDGIVKHIPTRQIPVGPSPIQRLIAFLGV